MRRALAALMVTVTVLLSGCAKSAPSRVVSMADSSDDASAPNLDLSAVKVASDSKGFTITWARTDDADLKPGDSLNFIGLENGQVKLKISVGQKANGDWTSTVNNGDLKTKCTRVTVRAREVSCVLPPKVHLPKKFGWTASTSTAAGPEDFLPDKVDGAQRPIQFR